MADQSVKIRILADSLEVSSSPNINIDRRTLFEANPDSISALVNCLEFSDDPSVRSDLSELISLLQIQDARLQTRQRRNMRGRVTSDNRTNAEHYLVDALEIYARSGRLLLYARLEDQEYKERELRDLMKSAAFLNNVEELNDSFEQIFGRRLQTLV